MREDMKGKVLELFITQGDEKKTRKNVLHIEVDKNGIIDDKFYAKNSQRAILITSLESYQLSKDNGINIETGSLGENILIDINPYSLLAGDRLFISGIELEITQNCTLCQGLSSVNSKLPKLLKNDRGIFAKVISQSGIIKIDDEVQILNH
jgi:MOSC domain-containing protein YiiM